MTATASQDKKDAPLKLQVPDSLQLGAWEWEGGQPDNLAPADHTIVTLLGAIDAAAAPALRERLIGVLHRGARLLILDLSRVLSCDAAGLAVLIGTQRRARLLGAKMCLAAPSLPVIRQLRLTGLDRSLTICPDLSGAITSQRSGYARPAKDGPDKALSPGSLSASKLGQSVSR